MLTATAYLTVVFVCAVLAVLVRLPPLVGFLAAGFVLRGLGVAEVPVVETMAELGVTLLLFGIGLKLDVRGLLRRDLWGTAVGHSLLTIPLAIALLEGLGLLGVALLHQEHWRTFVLLGFALSFSSTVVVVKSLEDHSEDRSLHGRLAIGVLIIQDLMAVVFLAATAPSPPHLWAIALVALIPGARVLRRVWDRLGHGEMQLLFGLFVALVPGYLLFEAAGLKGHLGALVMGVLLAGHRRSTELSRSLLSLKDLLLVAFFVGIGYSGTLTPTAVGLGLVLLLLVPVQAAIYVALLRGFSLRSRTSVLTGLSLANHSEFGLIVAAVGAEAGWISGDWVVVLSIAVASSFVVFTVVDRHRYRITRAVAPRIPPPDPTKVPPDDRPVDLAGVGVVVLGMGRIGRAAYHRLQQHHGLAVRGIESDSGRVRVLRAAGLDVVEADASDREFWQRVAGVDSIRYAVLAMPFHGSNRIALSRLREAGFAGGVGAVAQYDDEVSELRRHGVAAVLHLYEGAGSALADSTVEGTPAVDNES
jgi:glutathione-regulated potassium-efflux system ancillary protein KefC